MLKKKGIYTIILLLLFLIEASPERFIHFLGVPPELLLPCVILIAMFEKEKYGAICGLIVGIFIDTQSKIIGFNALYFMILGFFIGMIMSALIRINIYSVILLIFSGVFLHNVFTYLFFFVLYGNTSFRFAFLSIIIPKTVLSTVLGVAMYFGFKKLRINVFQKNEEIIT
jgi:rod shape-determining protein MreD